MGVSLYWHLRRALEAAFLLSTLLKVHVDRTQLNDNQYIHCDPEFSLIFELDFARAETIIYHSPAAQRTHFIVGAD